jgi:hypothetical protein
MISAGARRLYQRLLATGPVFPAELGMDATDPKLRELLDLGFIRLVAERFLAIPPRNARADVALGTSRHLRRLAGDALDVERYLESLAPVRTGSGVGGNELVEFIDSGAEVSLLSGTLPRQATRSVCAIHTALFPSRKGDRYGVVGRHVRDLLAKLGTQTRTGALASAMRRGFVS